jgi:hypothetical protein
MTRPPAPFFCVNMFTVLSGLPCLRALLGGAARFLVALYPSSLFRHYHHCPVLACCLDLVVRCAVVSRFPLVIPMPPPGNQHSFAASEARAKIALSQS